MAQDHECARRATPLAEDPTAGGLREQRGREQDVVELLLVAAERAPGGPRMKSGCSLMSRTGGAPTCESTRPGAISTWSDHGWITGSGRATQPRSTSGTRTGGPPSARLHATCTPEHVRVAGRDHDHLAQLADPGRRGIVQVADRAPEQVPGRGANQLAVLPDPDLRLRGHPVQVWLELEDVHLVAGPGQFVLLPGGPTLAGGRHPLSLVVADPADLDPACSTVQVRQIRKVSVALLSTTPPWTPDRGSGQGRRSDLVGRPRLAPAVLAHTVVRDRIVAIEVLGDPQRLVALVPGHPCGS